MPWISVEDYKLAGGWTRPEQREARSRTWCELLERGQVLFFREPPFDLPREDRDFLVAQEWAELRMHKNVSYRPTEDILRGVTGDAATVERVHAILRNYSAQLIDFLTKFLLPYAGKWTVDFSSFRPFEEERRGLPLHKRNDLLHVDAFPSRPTRGGRILRVFTNLNPTKPRVWNTTDSFEVLARRYAKDAGLERIAEDSWVSRTVQDWGEKLGFRGNGPHAVRHVHARLSRLSEGEHGVPEELPEDPDGISAALDLAGVHGWRRARGDVRAVCARADVSGSAAGAGRAGSRPVSNPRKYRRTPAGFVIGRILTAVFLPITLSRFAS